MPCGICHSCSAMAAQPGAGVTLFPSLSLHPLLSPTVLHRGALGEPSRHYCLFGVKVRPGRRCERKAVKNLSDTPRAARKLHRGQIRCSAYAWARSRKSMVNASAKQRWRGFRGNTPQGSPDQGRWDHVGSQSSHTRARACRSRVRNTHKCMPITRAQRRHGKWGGCTPWALLMRRSLGTGTKTGECGPSIVPIVTLLLRLRKPERDGASV